MLIIIPTRMRRLMNDLTMRYCTNYSCFTLYWIGGAKRLQHCPWKTMSDERSRRLATLRKRKQRDDDNNRSLEREYDRTRKRSAIQAETETDRRFSASGSAQLGIMALCACALPDCASAENCTRVCS